MRVRFIKTLSSDRTVFRKGQVYSLDEAQAREVIAADVAAAEPQQDDEPTDQPAKPRRAIKQQKQP